MQNQRTASDLSQDYQSSVQATENSIVKSTASELQQKALFAELTIGRKSDEEVTTIVREYDTNKEIDPETGKPPLLRETTQTRNRTDTANQQLGIRQAENAQGNTSSETENNKETLMQDEGSLRQTDETDANSTTIRGLTRLEIFLCTLGIVALSALAIWVFWKIKTYL